MIDSAEPVNERQSWNSPIDKGGLLEMLVHESRKSALGNIVIEVLTWTVSMHSLAQIAVWSKLQFSTDWTRSFVNRAITSASTHATMTGANAARVERTKADFRLIPAAASTGIEGIFSTHSGTSSGSQNSCVRQ